MSTEGMTADTVETPATETPVGGAPEAAVPAESSSPEGNEVVTPEEYIPNFKFKYAAADSKDAKEGEIDEFLRPVIKDKATEAKIHDLYTKAYGLDFLKPKAEEARTQVKQLEQKWQTEHEPLVKDLRQLGHAIQNDDIDTVIEKLQIPPQKVLQWAVNRVRYQEMAPDERARVDQERDLRRRAEMGQTASEQLQERLLHQDAQMRAMHLEHLMEKPEVSNIVQDVDTRYGKPGKFKELVFERGMIAYQMTGKDIPVEQALQEVVQMFGPWSQGAQAGAPGTGSSGAQIPHPGGKEKPPVIPNINGRATSPVKRVPTNLAELKAMAKEALE